MDPVTALDLRSVSRRLDAPELSRIQLRRSTSESFSPIESVDLDEEELSTVITAASGRSSQGGQQYPLALPVTSAENYGWVLFEESNTKKWRKPRITDPIVRHAERYCEQKGFYPYSKLMLRQRAERAIAARREREEARAQLVSETREAEKLRFQLEFMSSGKTQNVSREKEQEAKKKREELLNQRRCRLRALLDSEEQEYASRIAAEVETPAERIQRIKERAEKLKADREAERLSFVEEKLKEKWRRDTDELRTQNKKIWQLETVAVLQHQIQEKKKGKEIERNENELFENLWKSDYMNKLQREANEAREKALRYQAVKQVLDDQVRIKQDRGETGPVPEATGLLWEDTERKKFKEKFKSHAPTVDEAEKRRSELQTQKQIEQEENNRLVQELIAKERARVESELKLRAATAESMRKFIAESRLHAERKKATELEVERIQAEESEKQWAVRLGKWQLEEEARANLMRSVYADRENQINEKLSRISQMKTEYEEEVKRIDFEISQDRQWTQNKQLVTKKRNEEYKKALLDQIGKKERERESDHLALQQDMLREREQADILTRQIEAEKQKQRALIESLRRTVV